MQMFLQQRGYYQRPIIDMHRAHQWYHKMHGFLPASRASRVALVLILAFIPFVTLWMPSSTVSSFVMSRWRGTVKDRLNELRLANEVSPLYPEERVVVSITTFAGRMDKVAYTLQSLKDQSRKPDVVYLAIPDKVERLGDVAGEENENADSVQQHMEEKIKKLTEFFEPNLTLRVLATEDFGPSTKLLAALEQEKDPNTVIITLDDDTEYHEDTVLLLLDGIVRNPGYAPCFVCQYFVPYVLVGFQTWEGPCAGWANAFAGVAFRVGYFGPEIFDFSAAPSGCKLHDDVWISGNMYRNGHRPYILAPGFKTVLLHRHSGNLSVGSVPRTEQDYRDPCVRHFDLFN